jgi:hypothetical protein
MFSEDCFPSDQELADYYDRHGVLGGMAVATKDGTLKISHSDGKWFMADKELTLEILKSKYAEAVADCKRAGFTDEDWNDANQIVDEILKETSNGK